MISDILQPTHLLFILAVALLVLGPKRLPEVGRALGRGLRDFKNALNSDELRDQMISSTDAETPPPVEQPPAAPPEAPVGHVADDPAPATSVPASSASSGDDSAPSTAETTHSSEPTSAAPTPQRVP